MTTFARPTNPLGSDRSAQPMPGLSKRAQAALAPRQHTQFTRAVSAESRWPDGTPRSTDNGFTRPAGPSVLTARTAKELAADEAKRQVFLHADKKSRKED